MLYFEDFAGCRRLVSSNTAFLVSDRDFIFETFNALTRKSYFEAEGTISYVDGADDYTFKTKTLSPGFSNISDLLKGPLCERFDRIRECSMKIDFIYKYPGEYRRDHKARDVRLWYNSITGRMYMSENAKRLLYLSDTLPAVSCELEEMLGHSGGHSRYRRDASMGRGNYRLSQLPLRVSNCTGPPVSGVGSGSAVLCPSLHRLRRPFRGKWYAEGTVPS